MKIKCSSCGYQHEKDINPIILEKGIKFWTCCPVCTKDLPPDSDPIWDDPNFVSFVQTEHYVA